jgi:hypothetical protein
METEKVTATQSTTVTDITVFDGKNSFENTINQAWRRPEPEAVQQLLQFAKLPNELNKRFMNWRSVYPAVYVSVKLLRAKQALCKVYCKSFHCPLTKV